MTHPIHSADADLDLDRLEALAKAATPGDWTAKPQGRLIGGPMRHYVNGSGQAQIAAFSVTYHDQAPDDEPERQQANTDFSAGFSPTTALRLVAMARAAAQVGAKGAADSIDTPDFQALLSKFQAAVLPRDTRTITQFGEAATTYADVVTRINHFIRARLAAGAPASRMDLMDTTSHEEGRHTICTTLPRKHGCIPNPNHLVDEAVDQPKPDAFGDQWHSLTCDGTCSPPCKDAAK